MMLRTVAHFCLLWSLRGYGLALASCCRPHLKRAFCRRGPCGMPAAGFVEVVLDRLDWDHGHLPPAICTSRLTVRLGRSGLLAQSSVGKRSISKGIGGGIRRFAYSPFKSHVFGASERVSAQIVGLLRAALLERCRQARSFNCAVPMMLMRDVSARYCRVWFDFARIRLEFRGTSAPGTAFAASRGAVELPDFLKML